MAEGSNSATAFLESTSLIPIALLSPLLSWPASRSLKAIVTLTWPYSSVTDSVAFLLAEPDSRLRRSRGQVRVQFSGSSAKAIAQSGIASGDEVVLCLDGAEWVNDQDTVSTPGKGVEFELIFKERLLLQFRQEDSENVALIDIDHPPQPDLENCSQFRLPFPQATPLPAQEATITSAEVAIDDAAKPNHEWSSPAFIKRARTSYGSLFDTEYDPFAEEDGTIRGKGRKRTRVSSTWRFHSRSPSPEVADSMNESLDQASREPTVAPRPMMLDEGCQTVGLEVGDAAEVLASFSRQDLNVGSSSFQGVGENLEPARDHTFTRRGNKGGQQDSVPAEEMQLPESALNAERSHDEANGSSIYSSQFPPAESPVNSPGAGGANLLPLPPVIEERHMRESYTIPDHIVKSPIQASEEPNPVDEQDDLYSASPLRRHSDISVVSYEGLDKPAYRRHGPTDEFTLLEHQYGHWQADRALLNSTTTQQRVADLATPFDFLNETSGDSGHGPGTTDYQPSPRILPNYAEADEVPINDDNNIWQESPAAVRYPDLPDSSVWHEAGSAAQKTLVGGSTMSRSQSTQSVVVDLTETDDDEDDQDEAGEGSDDIADQISVDAESGEDEVVDENAKRDTRHDEDISDGSQIDAGTDQEDSERDDGFKNSTSHLEPAYPSDDDDNEAEYYNEEMEYEEASPRSPVPRASQPPVVIDLLSSDEEDEGLDTASKSRSFQAFRKRLNAEHSESEESDQDVNNEENLGSSEIPLVEESEFQTEIARFSGEEIFAPGDDEAAEDNGAVNGSPNGPRLSSPYSNNSAASDIESIANQAEAFSNEHGGKEARQVSFSPDTRESDKQGEKPKNDFEDQYTMSAMGSIVQQALRRPSVYDHRFSLDGIDESSEVASYSDLQPRENPTPPSMAQGDSQHALGSEKERLISRALHQLPTPDTTQITDHLIMDNQAVSFASTTSLPEEPSKILPRDATNGHTSELHEETLTGDESAQLRLADTTAVNEEPSQMEDISSSSRPQDKDEFLDDEPTQANTEDASATAKLLTSIQKAWMVGEETKAAEASIAHLHNQNNKGLYGRRTLEDTTTVHQVEVQPDADDARTLIEEGLLGGRIVAGLEHHQIAEVSEDILGTAISEDTIMHRYEAHHTSLMELDKGGEADENEEETNNEDEASPKVAVNGNEAEVEQGRNISTGECTTAHITSETEHSSGKYQDATPQQEVPARPRRSQRMVKSTSVVEVQIPARPVTPIDIEPNKGAGSLDEEPPLILDSPSTPEGYDASIELALDSLNSPSTQHREPRKVPVIDIKLRLTRYLRNELRQFTSLKVLRYHLGKKLDVLAIATSTPADAERAKSGPRHYTITFNITDPSVAPSGVSQVQVFRPYKAALPVVKAGDGVLLRNFEVISIKNRGFGLRSDDPSSWAVFKHEGDVETRGPPVELEGGETKYINDMKAWYNALDESALAKLQRANASKATAGVVGKGIGKAL